ncbi:MAG: SBBP repeat-containing protein [Chloroflexi bacterium]|nr:SBBP repeat-containing protein [Chloroflexota bacterium]
MHYKTRPLVNAIAIFVLLAAIIGVPTKFTQAEALSRPDYADGDYLWAKNWYIPNNNRSSIAVDTSGNVYITGRFLGTVDFDPSGATFNVSSIGTDIYISKFDSDGNFIWVKTMGGSGPNATTVTHTNNSIAIDGNGNVYVTGRSCGTTDFDPGPGVTALSSIGICDLYIAELDSNGNFVKARNMGGISAGVEGYDIAVDEAGNIYTTGQFIGTVDFNPGAGEAKITSAGRWDVFISKLNSNGNYVFAKSMGGTNDEQGLNLVVDKLGNIYTAGSYIGTVDFDPGSGTFNLPSCDYPGMICGFLSKLNKNGNFVLAKSIGDVNKDLALDSGNNILVVGSIAHANTSLQNPSFPEPTTDFIVIDKLDNAGNLIWRNELGTESSGGGSGKSITVDVSDNVYVTGKFIGTVDFDPGPGVYNLTGTGVDMLDDIFISKWDSSGNLILAKAIGGGFFYDWGTDIAVDLQGNMHTTGFFQGTVDFDPGPGTVNLTSTKAGWPDIFVSKLDGDIIPPIFTDVPFSYWANGHIERLYNASVTGGCSTSPMMYCPESYVNRAQMAIFILRAKHGNTYNPPAATGTVFSDVPANYWAAAWIEQLATEGVTGGCGNGNYCPEDAVTRDQMAVFLLLGMNDATYTPPLASGTMFDDVPQIYWAADWIEQLATEGITGGCGGGNFCPTGPVTRAQMAVFLVEAFNLP